MIVVFQRTAMAAVRCDLLFQESKVATSGETLRYFDPRTGTDRFGDKAYPRGKDIYLMSPPDGGIRTLYYPGNDKHLPSHVILAMVDGAGPRGRDHAIQIAIPLTFDSTTRQKIEDGVLSSLESIPLSFIRLIREIRVNPEDYVLDFGRVHVDSDRTAATGGNGDVDFFPSSLPNLKHGYARALLRHEFGHVLAKALWNDFTPPPGYIRGAKADRTAVSEYGSTHWAEDWAEAVVEYLKWHEGFISDRRDELSGRFLFMDSVFLKPIAKPTEIETLRRKFLGN